MNEIIKRIPNIICIPKFIITFSYETKKTGKYKESQRTMFAVDGFERFSFQCWANEQRTMSNVKILGIVKSNETKEIHV